MQEKRKNKFLFASLLALPYICALLSIFATNLRNEYSLIALAMVKMKDERGFRIYNDETVWRYIERVRDNAEIQRFR